MRSAYWGVTAWISTIQSQACNRKIYLIENYISIQIKVDVGCDARSKSAVPKLGQNSNIKQEKEWADVRGIAGNRDSIEDF